MSSLNNNIYLATYLLQQDMRIRLPKQILNNMGVSRGETLFDVYINPETNELILKVSKKQEGDINDRK